MNKRKAIICTILYIIVVTVALTALRFAESPINGINLYQLVMCVIGSIWVCASVIKFYEWLVK